MIADKIKNARTIKKLTQEQVAEDLNVSRQTISNWEMGVSVPNINTLILISEKFDIPVDEMLKSGDVVEKIDNNKTPFKKDRNYSIVFLTIGILGLISIPFEMGCRHLVQASGATLGQASARSAAWGRGL